MKTQQLPLNPPFYYGWMIVVISALAVFFSGPGQTYSISIFIDAYLEDFGWSSTLVSSMYTFATLAAGSLLFLIGRAVDRFGARKMLVIVSVMLGLASLFNSFIVGPVMLFIGFFMIRLFGQGSMVLIPGTLVPQWFEAKRGRALSFMAIGAFTSASLLPILNAWLIDTIGWPMTWRFWGILLLIFFAPLAFWLVRNKPEDVGLVPDGKSINDGNEGQTASKSNDDESWTVREAVKTRAFWAVLLGVGVPSMVNTGIVFHFIAIAAEHGISTQIAALIISLMAFLSFPVSLVAGYILDRIKVRYVFAFALFAQAVIMIWLAFAVSPWMAVIFGLGRGVVEGFEKISVNYVFPAYFGRQYLASIRSIGSTMTVVGSALGPLPLALSYDWFGTYQPMILVLAILPLLASVFMFMTPKPEKQAYMQRESAS
ncbi:MFS transporter [Texcoconibacillus texcoconensis]|uniref:MFS family permease n=1 Tax=Texcoconibacillus texcoconensis TaxID=1095777 RepID=A0A840QRX5_9BACI|nr:MFS transporter [Texcoconibacillus texcoconensis]MBB5174246.1 MFS family permease [Texcoconibacillus texcoconensis]